MRDDEHGSRIGEQPTECSECGGQLIADTTHNEFTCEDCGLVQDMPPSLDQDWREYEPGDRDKKSRVGSPAGRELADKGLTTRIGDSGKDGKGNHLEGENKRQAKALKREQTRTKSEQERTLQRGNSEIELLTNTLNLDKQTEDTARRLFRKIKEKEMLEGRSQAAFAAGVVFVSCRQMREPISREMILEESDVDDVQKLSKVRNLIIEELGIDVPFLKAQNHIDRIFAQCAPQEDEFPRRRAYEFINILEGTPGFSDKSPTGMAAGALYAAFQELNITESPSQAQIAEFAGASRTTVGKRYREIRDALVEAGEWGE